MPIRNNKTKQENRVDKISGRKSTGRLKSTESTSRGREHRRLECHASSDLSVDQPRSVAHTGSRSRSKTQKSETFVPMFVPVVDRHNNPLMPTTPARARKWIKSRKATPFWKKGVFCVRLNVKPSGDEKQDIVVGIDPGSKREAYTIKSEPHTYLNVLTETPDWVKEAVATRREMRRSRRQRKTPCRQNRRNRSRGGLVPSTKARWQLKLRVLKWLKQMFPITHIIVEDIKAKTTGKRRWDVAFSPLETGKKWFYDKVKEIGGLSTKQGFETKELRDSLGLKKSSSKLKDTFDCHNVDSWVLANSIVGGHVLPDNKTILKIVPLRFHRRQLHYLQPSKGGIRKNYGGTRSLGFKRGSLVKHPKYGLCYVGGTSSGRISVHSLKTGKRLSTYVKTEDCEFKTYLGWRLANSPNE